MVEADSHLNLLPASTLDKYKVFEQIDMLSISMQHAEAALHCYTHPTWLRVWVSWSLEKSK
jgi:hypothetical protein